MKNELDASVERARKRIVALTSAELCARAARKPEIARSYRSIVKEALRDLAQALQDRHEQGGTDFVTEWTNLDAAYRWVRKARLAGLEGA